MARYREELRENLTGKEYISFKEYVSLVMDIKNWRTMLWRTLVVFSFGVLAGMLFFNERLGDVPTESLLIFVLTLHALVVTLRAERRHLMRQEIDRLEARLELLEGRHDA